MQALTAATLGAPALAAPRWRARRSRCARPPAALFGGLFGRKEEKVAAPSAAEAAAERAARAALPSPLPPGAADVLDGTVLQGEPLVLSYDAQRDGWTAAAFHAACDNKGPGLLLARTQGGARFGAFNNLGWASREDYRDSNGAFLMRWAPGTPADAPPEILAKVGSPAIFDYGVSGPCFGADALKIPLGLAPANGSSYAVVGSSDLGAANAAGGCGARSRLGSHYARRADGGRTLFADEEGMDAQLTELRVYTSPGREGYYL